MLSNLKKKNKLIHDDAYNTLISICKTLDKIGTQLYDSLQPNNLFLKTMNKLEPDINEFYSDESLPKYIDAKIRHQ